MLSLSKCCAGLWPAQPERLWVRWRARLRRHDPAFQRIQAEQRHAEGDALYGLPPGLDPLEGWIVTAEARSPPHP
jgi:hypothetical protein